MAKIADIAKNLFNLGKGIGLEKPREGNQKEFNLDKFKSELQSTNSLMRANRYVVTIYPGPEWSWTGPETPKSLTFFCDAVNMPGLSINPSDISRLGVGPYDRRPGRLLPSEISASFMLDQNGRNLNFFQEWVYNVINMDGSKPLGERNGAQFGEQYYRDNYIGKMDITTYDVSANKILTLTAHEIWPSVLGDVTMGWQQNDEFARVQVNFQLRYWTTDLQEGPGPATDRALGGFERLIRLGTAGTSLISSMKTPNNVGDAINIISNAQTFLGALGGKNN